MDNVNQAPKSSPVVPVIVFTIIGLLVGFGIAKLSNKKMDSTSSSMTASAPAADTKAADLRSALVTLGVAHQDLTQEAVDAALDGSADAGDMKTALIANGTSISAAVGSVYGSDAQSKFQSIWNVHLVDFVNYAVAAKQGNATAKAAALADIDANYTKPIVALLSGANPKLPAATLTTVFDDHISMTAGIIDDHVAGNYAKEATDQTAAETHIAALMSALATGIVQQYPSKF